jgi:chromosomal replication initiation ATPase DnaA
MSSVLELFAVALAAFAIGSSYERLQLIFVRIFPHIFGHGKTLEGSVSAEERQSSCSLETEQSQHSATPILDDSVSNHSDRSALLARVKTSLSLPANAAPTGNFPQWSKLAETADDDTRDAMLFLEGQALRYASPLTGEETRGRDQHGILLWGEPGSGKTQLFHSWMQ